MNLINLYHFYKGYVTVKITGYQLERFLNVSVNRGIYFWNLKKISDKEMTLCITIKGFKKLRQTAYRTRTKMKILNRVGAYKYVKQAKNRKIFFLTVIFCFVLIFGLTSFILDIEITGNHSVSEEALLEQLNEVGVARFRLRSGVDEEDVSLKLINSFDHIAWVGLTEQGTRIIVEIKERTPPPIMVPKEIPCHLIAAKDAVIERMNVENGEPLVKLGQVIVKGQILVSGVINTRLDGQRYVHAMGEVIGKTWYEKILPVKLYRYEKEYTGNTDSRFLLKTFSKEWDLSFGKVDPFYNSDEETKRWIVGFLEFQKKTYQEYSLKRVPLTEEEAINEAKEDLLAELKKLYPEERIKSVAFQAEYIDEETRNLRILAQCEEQIAQALEIKKGE